MHLNDTIVHQREIKATLSEEEIHAILAAHVATAAGVQVADCSEIRAFISSKDRTGTSGREYYADVKLTTSEGL